jgi:arylsulfatase A-like enzyme
MRSRSTNVLLFAICFGIAFGLLEAAALLYFAGTAPLSSPMGQSGVNAHILWIAPALDAAAFLLIGVVLLGVLALRPRRPAQQIAWLVFSFLAVYGLLLAPMRLTPWATRILAIGFTLALFRLVRPRMETAAQLLRCALPTLAGVWLLLGVGINVQERFREWSAVRNLTPARPGSPNVLLIVLDTVRADKMSAYGYARPTTPFLERLAREGTLFTHAVATSSWTLPSHASLFTGLHPYQHGATDERLDAKHPTLAEAFAGAGYRTAGFTANTIMTQRRTGLDRGFHRYEDLFHSLDDAAARTTYGRRIFRLRERWQGFDWPGRKQAPAVTRSFLRWLDAGSDRPFFVFLNYFDVHAPYKPAREFATKFSALPERLLTRKPFNGRTYSEASFDDATRQDERDAYDAALGQLDAHLEALFGELQARGLLENTLVVITSDHGESLFEHGAFGHSMHLYREALHVPLLFYWPGHVPASRRDARPVDLTAVPATLLALAGIRSEFNGQNLVPFDRGAGDPDEGRSVLAELSRNPWAPPEWPNHRGWLRSLVDAQWHFLVHQGGRVELYDWRNDPSEQNDLSLSPGHAATVQQFHQQLEQRHSVTVAERHR